VKDDLLYKQASFDKKRDIKEGVIAPFCGVRACSVAF